MDRNAFLAAMAQRIAVLRAPDDQRRARALARSQRIDEICAIIQPYADALTVAEVDNALTMQGAPPENLTWALSLNDGTALILSVADDAREEELRLSFTHTAYQGIYLDLSFLHRRDPESAVEAEVSQVHLDERWSAAAFEQLVQDMITAFLAEVEAHKQRRR